MKKFLISSFILISAPVIAACSIDGDTTACSIAQFEQQPMVQTYSPKPGIQEFSGTPEARLKPARVDAPQKELRNFRQQENDFSYNSSCQFGVCNQTGAPQLFQMRNEK